MVYLMNKEKPIKILLVAENENIIENVWVEFQKARLGNSVFAVESGHQALDFLLNRGMYSQRKYVNPDLIVISFKLSDTKGVDVFNEISGNPQLSHIPIIFLGSTNGEKVSGWMGAEKNIAYIPKPFTYSVFSKKLKEIGVRWAMSEELPILFFSNNNKIKRGKNGQDKGMARKGTAFTN